MATFSKRRNGDGSTSYDALVRIVGYPPISRSFPAQLAAELWASRKETACKGRSVPSARGMTLEDLIDAGMPKLKNPVKAVFAYWRRALGKVRLLKITPELIALHRDRLLGAECRGYWNKSSKPRSAQTTRNYLIEFRRLFTVAVQHVLPKQLIRVGERNLRTAGVEHLCGENGIAHFLSWQRILQQLIRA